MIRHLSWFSDACNTGGSTQHILMKETREDGRLCVYDS